MQPAYSDFPATNRCSKRPFWPLWVALLASGYGCVEQQHDGFTGSITTGKTTVVGNATVPLSGDFGAIPPHSPRAYWGFPLSGRRGSIILVYDQAAAGKDAKISNRSLVDVYYYSSSQWLGNRHELEPVLCADSPAASQEKQLHHLSGKFNVTRWENNIDFRVEMAMQSSDAQPVKVSGVLASYNREEFNPGRSIVYMLEDLRLASDSAEAPQVQANRGP